MSLTTQSVEERELHTGKLTFERRIAYLRAISRHKLYLSQIQRR